MALLLVVACGDDNVEYTPPQKLEIASADVDFDAKGGTGTILYTTATDGVEATSNVDWCSVSSSSSIGIEFTLNENTSLTTRTATITLKSGDMSGTVSITQRGVIMDYDFTDTYTYADNKAFSQTIKFTSDIAPKVVIAPADASWLKCEATSGGYTVSAVANTSGAARLGKVTFDLGGVAKSYTFFQYGESDLCHNWNATYLDGDGETVTEKFIIQATETAGLYLFAFASSQYIGGLYYKDGALKIPFLQTCPLEGVKYTLVWGGMSSSSPSYVLDKNATYQLKPVVKDDGSWRLEFVDDGSYAGGITGLAIWALQGNTIAGYWAQFKNIVLTDYIRK